MSRHYLDHASTSPARPEVVEAMLEWLTGTGGADQGRAHTEGRMARAAIEGAREQVAALLRVQPRQVIFTSGATESANAAVHGAAMARPGAAIVCPAVEHSCVRDASRRVAPTIEVGVDAHGRIDPDAFETALDRGGPTGVALAHCQWGNHEVATVQPVHEVLERCRRRQVLTHVDAAAAAGQVRLDLGNLGADLVSVSAHKLGGPKGMGALVVRRGLRLDPLIVGGEQERARRAGMENVPAIVGFGAAAEALGSDGCRRLNEEAAAARRRTGRVLGAAGAEGIVAYGDPVDRLPHIACLGVAGVEAEAVLLGLDQVGIAVHSGSACASESLAPSPVLEAMGADADRSLRVSVGWSSTDEDIEAFLVALPRVIRRLRSLRS